MTAIRRISTLRGYGIFRDFSWPDDLPDFGKYNLIYGTNGTGKTTLSRLLRALEQKQSLSAGSATIALDSGEVSGAAFTDTIVPIRVFNRDFVRENVFPVDGSDVAPVYVLGVKNVELQRQLDSLGKRRGEEQANLAEVRRNQRQAEQQLDQLCVNRADLIRQSLPPADVTKYRNYDKRNFKTRTQQMLDADDRSTHKADEGERAQLLVQFRATSKERLRLLPDPLDEIEAAREEVVRLLRQTITATAIAELSDAPGLASWARTGLELHQHLQTDVCQFCAQPLPSERVRALELHFNDAHERMLSEIDSAISSISEAAARWANLVLPRRAELLEHLAAEYESAKQDALESVEVAKTLLVAFRTALEAKRHRVFAETVLPADLPALTKNGIAAFNALISRHNEDCDDLAKRRVDAGQRFEAGIVEDALDEFLRLTGECESLGHEVDRGQTSLRLIDREIEQTERQLREHHRPAEELNEDLVHYLGHKEIQLVVKDAGYEIRREGEPARALSEGEQTAIALLYFLKSLEDRGFDKSNGIVVLDDPVSSLDSGALYLALGFVQARTSQVGQLFILTHNFTFFRQARRWLEYAKNQSCFYMLDCRLGATGRATRLSVLDPLLKKYESDYHYLFAKVLHAATQPAAGGLEEHYALPNMARRLLETFLAFRHPEDTSGLYQTLKAVQFDEAKKVTILRFVDANSHADAIGGTDSDLSILTESTAVLGDLIELMEQEDPGHVRAMRAAIAKYDQDAG